MGRSVSEKRIEIRILEELSKLCQNHPSQAKVNAFFSFFKKKNFTHVKPLLSPIFIRENKIFFSLIIPVTDSQSYEPVRSVLEKNLVKFFPNYQFYISLTREKRGTSTLGSNLSSSSVNIVNDQRFSIPFVAVASGKGGVGKSTTAFNLALALAQQGLKIGLLDADIYGPSLMGLAQLKDVQLEYVDKKIKPFEKFGIKMMSIGFFLEEAKPVIWRAPMALGALKKMLYDVIWGDIDLLIGDMPPGTGDIPLSLVQHTPVNYAVIVSTPQTIALMDVRKAIAMYQKLKTPILGIVENMSYFIAPDTNKIYHIFGQGRVEQEALLRNLPFLGRIPLDPIISEDCDLGKPVLLQKEKKEYHEIYRNIANKIIEIVLKNKS